MHGSGIIGQRKHSMPSQLRKFGVTECNRCINANNLCEMPVHITFILPTNPDNCQSPLFERLCQRQEDRDLWAEAYRKIGLDV